MKILAPPSSGSYQGIVWSHNRFGQYVRSRSTPVNPNTTFQQAVRARQTYSATHWRTLTTDQRAAWKDLGNQITRTDSLGSAYTLTGLQAYALVNNNLAAAGNARIADPPALVYPDVLLTMTPTITHTTFSVAWTTTPLATGERAFIFASPQRSAGRSFEHDYRLIAVTAAAAASPLDIFAAYSARCGAPVIGNRIFVSALKFFAGFVSPPLNATTVVAT